MWVASVVEAVVKWALAWPAKGWVAGKGLLGCAGVLRPFGGVQSASGFPGRWAVVSAGYLRVERHRAPRFCAKCFQGTGWYRRCFPRWRVVKWRRGLLAWVLAVSKRPGVPANLPACVCLGRGLRPTVRAADTASPCANRGGFKPKNFRLPSCWTNTPCR